MAVSVLVVPAIRSGTRRLKRLMTTRPTHLGLAKEKWSHGRDGRHLRDTRNERQLMAMYEARLSRWPVDFECRQVPTRYGLTHVIASGSRGAPPLLLLRGLGVNTTLWLPNVWKHFLARIVSTRRYHR